MDAIPDRGRLSGAAFPSLLLVLHGAGFSGSLRVLRDRVEKVFLFQDGLPVFGESSLEGETLVARLRESGRLSEEDGQRAASYIEEHACKEGKALLDLQLLETRELFEALREQLRARLVECFRWPDGEFNVESTVAPPAATQPFRIDIVELMQVGIECHWGADRIFAALEPKLGLYPSGGEQLKSIRARLQRDAAVDAFVRALDGGKTLWQVLQLADTPRALAAAWVLDATKALEYAEKAPEAQEAPEEAAPEIEIVFGEDVDDADRAPPASATETAIDRPAHGAQPGHGSLAAEVAEKFSRLGELSHYELLGVSADAEASAIKRAYLKAAKAYHPDILARAETDERTRGMATRVFAEISRAHALLSDPGRRREYDASLGTAEESIDAERIATAETLFRKGEILMRQGNFRGALEFLKPAVELYPVEPEYQSALGWALYKMRPPELAEARDHLVAAVQLRDDDATSLFRLSLVLRDQGEVAAADQAAARAKRMDPNVSQ